MKNKIEMIHSISMNPHIMVKTVASLFAEALAMFLTNTVTHKDPRMQGATFTILKKCLAFECYHGLQCSTVVLNIASV